MQGKAEVRVEYEGEKIKDEWCLVNDSGATVERHE